MAIYLYSIYIVLGIKSILEMTYNYIGRSAQVICQYYTILYIRLEHLWILVSKSKSWNQSPIPMDSER